jgi:hypothetical protein
MTIVLIPTTHFEGGQNITPDNDTTKRTLSVLVREMETDCNTGTAHAAATGNPHGLTLADLGLTSPFQYKGAIAAASSFPTAAVAGWSYRITADVTDNDDTKTNTGQSFIAGDEIVWNGTGYDVFGAESVNVTLTGLALQTLGAKLSGALNGAAAQKFVPEKIVAIVTAATGAPNGDAQIKLGTTNGGSEIMAAHLLECATANEPTMILLEGRFPAIAGNATLYAEVTTADTKGACTCVVTLRVIGRQY